MRPDRTHRCECAVSPPLIATVVGAAFLRQLASQPQMAAPRTLRALRRHDRSPLGRHRRLLQTRKQSLAWLRRRPQQHNPRLPTVRLRPARRRISSPQRSHMHASAAMIPQNHPPDSLKTQNILRICAPHASTGLGRRAIEAQPLLQRPKAG